MARSPAPETRAAASTSTTPGRAAAKPTGRTWQRVAWFIGLWLAGVAVTAVVAYILRFLIFSVVA